MKYRVNALMAVLLVLGVCAVDARELRKVTGRVSDRTGVPLPRASVEFRNAAGEQLSGTETNAVGEFEVRLPEGPADLTARLAGFAVLQRRGVEVGPSTPSIELVLEVASIEQQIVVTATRTDTVLPQVGSSVTVLSGSQLRNDGYATVDDALRNAAGLETARSGGPGQITSLFMRGGESDYTKILIDGIPANDPGGSFNFANLSISDIDRIEIVRGPQSALFGSDAVAGVVQVFTRRGSGEGASPRPRISVEGGSYGTFRWSGGAEGRAGRVDYSTSFSRMDTDNAVANSSFNIETAAANVGWRPTEKSEFRFVFRSENGRTGVPGQTAFRPAEGDEYYRFRNLAGGITLAYRPSVRWHHNFAYTVTDSYQFSEDPGYSGSFVAQFEGRTAPFESYDYAFSTVNDTRRQRASWQADFSAPGGHLVSAGADFERESGRVGDPHDEPLLARRDNYAGFVQDQWSFRNRLFAAAGVRLEHNGSFGAFAAPRASFAFHIRDARGAGFWGATRLRGNFGLGMKEPTLVETYSLSPYFRGNPDLAAERSTSYDAGIEQQLGSGGIGLTWFDNRFRNQIGYAVTDPSTFEGSFFNIGRTRAHGVEGTYKQPLPAHWQLAGTWTWLDSRVIESTSAFDPAFESGRSLFRRPRHSGTADLRWSPGRWTLGATGILVGSRIDSDFVGLGMTRNPGHAALNILAALRIGNGSSLFAVFENVFNRAYMDVLGYPALGRRFRIGLRM
jgi:vitamin B12 transporter